MILFPNIIKDFNKVNSSQQSQQKPDFLDYKINRFLQVSVGLWLSDPVVINIDSPQGCALIMVLCFLQL